MMIMMTKMCLLSSNVRKDVRLFLFHIAFNIYFTKSINGQGRREGKSEEMETERGKLKGRFAWQKICSSLYKAQQ